LRSNPSGYTRGVRALPPWEINPHQLVGLWQMFIFNGGSIWLAGRCLERLKTDCVLKAPGSSGDHPVNPKVWSQPLVDSFGAVVADSLVLFVEHCDALNLSVTAAMTKDTIERLGRGGRANSYNWLKDQIDTLQSLFEKEIDGKLFIYVAPERTRFWPRVAEPNLFGAEVAKAFPSAAQDIRQAGMAIATHLSTAGVFHLMRVLEVALTVLGKEFGVSLANTNWGPAIEQIESRVRDMHKDPKWKALPDCKEQQAFYAQAAAHFGVLKDAWRNYTMHGHVQYDEFEVEQVFNAIKAFMQKLAQKLSE
jgi:hypothetical protein